MAKFSFNRQAKYRLLREEEIKTIHEKALFILERTGVKFDSEEALKILKDHGCDVDFDKQIAKIPGQLVLDSIKSTPEQIQLYDREGNPGVLLDGNHPHFAPGSAPINFMESDGVTVRTAEARDLRNISLVNDALDNIKLQATAVNLHDVPKLIGDSFRLYLLMQNSPKPAVSGAFSIHGIADMREMLMAIAGGEDALREKPRVIFDICPSPPLKWTHISCQNIIDCARFGLPIETISVPMPGAASPATLAGSVLLHTVETLSGIVLAQCVAPGTPMVYGGAPMYFDMRFSTTSLNSMEAELISAAYAQMAKFYGMPCHTYAALSDSKIVDVQAGLESGMSGLMALQAGINVISGAGVIDFCNTFSIEKLAIDNEICGMALRVAKGIECTEETLAVDLINELGPGGDFLSTEHTFEWFKKEPYMPSAIIDRRNRGSWEESGKTDTFYRARKKVQEIIEGHKPLELDKERKEALERVTKGIMERLNINEIPLGPSLA
ncbi:MAG: trimethylamine methyltransferase family protein [Bacillota bacterium]|jgi:trimethylamine--corrinoid protein Co-methyltransferase